MSAADGAMRQKVWDAPTRLFHWSIAGLVALSWWTAEERMFDWHRASGLAIAGLLAFRIYWGFAGPKTARFAHFLKGPRTTASYVRSLFGRTHTIAFGHNPLGGLSVLAMLLALTAHVGFGLFATDTDTGLNSGPLSRFVSYDVAEAAADLHEASFDILLVLLALHIAAIAFYLVIKRVNLITPMLTGRRVRAASGPEPGMSDAPAWRLALGLGLAGATIWLLAAL